MAPVSPLVTAKQVHQQIINEILADWPDAQTQGFARALKALPDAEYMAWMLEKEPDWYRVVNFVPDAWMVVPEKRHLVIFEAVHQHDVPASKFGKMVDLAWGLDEDHWRLILVRCDRFSRRAYDVRGASVCSDMELAAAGEKSRGWQVPDWQKYDYTYIEAFFADAR